MKKNFILALLVILVAVASCSFTNKSFDNDDKDKFLLELISYVLERGHYEPKEVNDTFSSNVFDDFIEVIDPTKRYFLESDIREFEKYRFMIDDEIRNTDIEFFNAVYQRLMVRMDEAKEIYKEVLAQPFDYSIDETIEIDYDKQEFATSKKELKERWRKQLKYNTLNVFDDKIDNRIADANADGSLNADAVMAFNEIPSSIDKAAIEEEAREVTKNTLDEFFDFVDDLERKDWFVQYLNTIVEEFDPHTFYFAPEEKERFDIGMSGKFEGIGARLQKKPEGAKIVEIISGGPVWRDQSLEVGDQILKVGQDGEEPINIVGMRLEDAIKLIKGPEGTVVDLTVRKVDGTIETVSITRDVVELEESYAKSATIDAGNEKFGLINLPKFYVDFEDYSERNAATDVAKELERLKEAGAEGIILDLRDNGGGSLKTVVEMAGLFIKDGPIVQVRSSGQRKEVHEDKDERIQWDGPLVILVNELSASASEILAAAMQDYKRAVIIGSKQTFGKGTVQNVIPLDGIVRGNEHGDLGAIKLTTQKFYRINGGSTQLEGVKSDIVVPDRYSYIDLGERDQQNPLGWDKITPADYEVWDGYIDFDDAVKKSKDRMATNEQIKLIEENARWVKEQQDENLISLRYDDYISKEQEAKKRAEKFKSLRDYDSKLSFSSLQYEKELFTQDSVLREKRNRWHQDLARDIYVEEAVNVLRDLHQNNIKKKESELASVNKG
ncbi:MAG: carboxy terminal-processing peptidase [Allomuricauda sp.]|jgi:carboxyl-terminal processing protease|uniref:Carboxy terminal-processing peptidase n=1 Tax=Flagellimonas sp. MMG031 TaxID=3158549 RepID=A0AAU7MYE1_9FLAO|nr:MULTISPECIES: carboxy terminal-processing peptidase [unclassified Allomuricauda]MBO6533795.1 carboxy terminal-processing peptidase [Allomuricauda sp.]MBO6587578.1 carboxy terminal-processing peptidase [Allomuricauda sp.]MBO6617203.1 carboxy terminal-processing peptidase [Allomuricauda sp.]MBO6643786.1 carboxy terminal-processing peptidase [Allomuricauda sp.]MBO6745538.1 carboxy terminal-processing peptidase [Allomuricauda sp.]